MASPPWLRNLSQSFKAHRLGRPGWSIELNHDRFAQVPGLQVDNWLPAA
jgi:hypothetical protein